MCFQIQYKANFGFFLGPGVQACGGFGAFLVEERKLVLWAKANLRAKRIQKRTRMAHETPGDVEIQEHDEEPAGRRGRGESGRPPGNEEGRRELPEKGHLGHAGAEHPDPGLPKRGGWGVKLRWVLV